MTGPFEADGRPQGVNGVGIRVLFVQLGSRKWTNLDSGWTNYRKPEICLHHNISDQDRTAFWADRSHDCCWTRRGGLSVCNIDARCSNTLRVDGQCLPTTLSSSSSCCCCVVQRLKSDKIFSQVDYLLTRTASTFSPSPHDAFRDLWGSTSSVSRHFIRTSAGHKSSVLEKSVRKFCSIFSRNQKSGLRSWLVPNCD